MVRLAFTLIGNNAEAEEVVQDSFVEISQRFDELDQPGAYLRTVVVSRCRSVLCAGGHRISPRRPSQWDVLETLPEHQRIAVVSLLRMQGLGDRQDRRPTCRTVGRIATCTGRDAQGAHGMSRFEETLQRDLRQIADRATPSSDAWNSILTRIADQDPIQETEIIMLTENTTTTRRWPLIAAAAAVVALAITGIALVNRDDGTETPSVKPPPAPTVATTAPIVSSQAQQLPDVGALVTPGRYMSNAPRGRRGVHARRGSDRALDRRRQPRSQAASQLWSDDTAREFIAIGRVGSWYDAEEARDEQNTRPRQHRPRRHRRLDRGERHHRRRQRRHRDRRSPDPVPPDPARHRAGRHCGLLPTGRATLYLGRVRFGRHDQRRFYPVPVQPRPAALDLAGRHG